MATPDLDPFNPLGSTQWDVQANENQQKAYTHKIHVRVQQRKKDCYITTISNMDDDLDLKRIAKAMRNAFSCSATIITDKEHGEVIQLSGDQRESIKAWLLEMEILTPSQAKERLVLHGA